LAACGSTNGEATPTVSIDSSNFSPVVSVTGEVRPIQWATLSSGAGGSIDEIFVELGQLVEQGELLMTLSTQPARQAAVAAAELELVQARQALDELEENADFALAQTQQELAQARDALDDAEYMYRVRQKGNRASQETIDAAEARLVLAENEVDRAKAEYDKYSGRDSDDPSRAVALRRLANARLDRDSALRSLNWYTGEPTEIDQALLDADVAVAQAEVNQAERELARRQDGPDTRLLEAARSRLENAEAQVAAARQALEDTEIRAPFDGTISQIYVRDFEWIAPGTPAFDLGDLSQFRIYTTDLNEIDAARVKIGDSASISYDALPDFSGTGTVVELAPKPSSGSSVNYSATIEVGEVPASITWGMTAFVDIEVQE
jgi:HlyD family secretion protein